MSFGNLGDFDSPDLDSSDGFAPIPNGTYALEIISAETATSSSGYVQLVLQCKITGPKFAGRNVFERIIIDYDGSPGDRQQKAVNIGKSKLKQLCTLNRLNRWPKGEKEVVGWTFSATLGHREYNGKYYEEISRFKAVNAAAGPSSTPSDIYLAAKAAHDAADAGIHQPSYANETDDSCPF